MPEEKIAALSTALDFTELTGFDANGKEVNVGKQFFTGVSMTYKASKKIDPGSPGTAQFMSYLKKHGRDDLLEKYFIKDSAP